MGEMKKKSVCRYADSKTGNDHDDHDHDDDETEGRQRGRSKQARKEREEETHTICMRTCGRLYQQQCRDATKKVSPVRHVSIQTKAGRGVEREMTNDKTQK
jgi:hypothetical protein